MGRVTGKSVRLLAMSAVMPAALLLGAGTAGAQWSAQQQQQQQRYPSQQRQSRYNTQQQLFVWQGRVDREMRIQMSNGRASVMQIGSNERGNGNIRAASRVPNQPGIVTVQQLEGRGRVDVVQQPDSRNGYTTIIRLRDPASGAANYRVAAYWQPTGNYSVYDNGSRKANGRRNNNAHDNGRHGDNPGHGHWY